MATLTDLEAERARLQALIAAISRRVNDLDQQISRLKSRIQELGTVDPNGFAIDTARRQLAAAENSLKLEQLALAQAQADLSRVLAQIQNYGSVTAPRASAGQVTAEAQTARDNNAPVQAPPTSGLVLDANGRVARAPNTTTPSNAQGATVEATTGTNAPVRAAGNLQSTPAATARTPIQPGSSSSPSGTPTAGATRGEAAPGDDASNGVVARINDIFGGSNARIIDQPNVLSQYASYTYNISIYIMDKDEYASLLQGRTSLNALNLLMRSGGAAVGQRNQFFPLDYYLDDLQIRSIINGRGTGGAHNAFQLRFKIFEPNGITFIKNLVAATQLYVAQRGGTAPQNYAAQNFLMAIRFYTYDEYGRPVNATGGLDPGDGTLSQQAAIEKLIPFQFTAVKFRIANRITEYECEAAAIRNVIGTSQTRGVIPYNIELTGQSLQGLLKGNLRFSTTGATVAGQTNQATEGRPSSNLPSTTASQAANDLFADQQRLSDIISGVDTSGLTLEDNSIPTPPVTAAAAPAPPKATAAPTKVLVTGLVNALNEYQAQIVRDQDFIYPDIYDIRLDEPILQNAKMQPPESAAGLQSTPMNANSTAAQAKDGRKQSVDRNSKNVSATAGMSIVQFLDQVVRTSTYIYDQQTKIWVQDVNGKWSTQPRGTNAQSMAWYRIGMEAVPYQYDEKRRDYAYRITYSITPYQVNDIKSDWFPNSQFTGVHKRYPYWFTGENSELLEYEQDYNYLYYIVVNGGQEPPSRLTDYRAYEKRAFQPRNNESSQGAAGPVNDPSASAASILYSPGDTARCRIKILGDPAWLQQGEMVTGIRGLDRVYYGPWLPDGTINYDSREILFEIAFNQPADYNLQTGLIDRTQT